MKRILITGKTSYIGTSFEKFLLNYPEDYQVDIISVRDHTWRSFDFSKYDVLLHCAGIAHADIGKISEEKRKEYYDINSDLSFNIAEKYREDRKKQQSQFIYLSSIIVYGDTINVTKKRIIDENTIAKPSNFYGDSKLQAEIKINELQTEEFCISIIRPPMVYGPNSKGNYPLLRKLALNLPIFPNFPNERSMIYVDNLSIFIKDLIDSINESKTYLPQNIEYVRTSDLVREIRYSHGKKIILISFFNWLIVFLSFIPGKIGRLTKKAFGNLTYKVTDSSFYETKFVSFEDSIRKTEGKKL